MVGNELRQKIIGDCLENKLPRLAANKALHDKNLPSMSPVELYSYDLIFNNYRVKNPRQRIIALALMQAVTKTDANILLFDAQYRKMSDEETEFYTDLATKIIYYKTQLEKRYGSNLEDFEQTEQNMDVAVENNDAIQNILMPEAIPIENIMSDCIKKELTEDEVNKILESNGYDKMSSSEAAEYNAKVVDMKTNRKILINESIDKLDKVFDVNERLKKAGFLTLSMIEEMDYERERNDIYSKRRLNLIKECIEEDMTLPATDEVLTKNGFTILAQFEYYKVKQEMYRNRINNMSENSVDLSNQFRTLYRAATKLFHPDKYTIPEEKEIANIRMKELNDAKNKNDYYLLKDLVKRYKKEDGIV